MKEGKFKELFAPTVVLVSICLVASLLLAGTFLVTEPKIAEITKANADAARAELMPAAAGFNDLAGTMDFVDGVDEVFEAEGGGYVITSHSKGFGGTVTVMTALDADGKIINVKVTDASNETPGLGSKATLTSHTDKFKGASKITSDSESKDGTYIQAVTGASYTSRAVFNSVSAALAQYAKIGGAK